MLGKCFDQWVTALNLDENTSSTPWVRRKNSNPHVSYKIMHRLGDWPTQWWVVGMLVGGDEEGR